MVYCRARVKGKLVFRSLGTKKLDIARIKLPKVLSLLRSLEVRNETNSLRESLDKWWKVKLIESDMQPATVNYWENGMKFVLKSLSPDKKLSDAQAVLWWAEKVKGIVSGNFANNLLGMMRGVMEMELASGARRVNPFTNIKKLRVDMPDLDLPSKTKFRSLIDHMRKSAHWSTQESADLVEWMGCDLAQSKRWIEG